MKLVKIGDGWINPEKVVMVYRRNSSTCVLFEETHDFYGNLVSDLDVDKPLDEVVAIINGGLE